MTVIAPRTLKSILAGLLMLLPFHPCLAQTDADGCADDAIFSRLPGYYIQECTTNYNSVDFYDSQGQDVKIEGNVHFLWYSFNSESGKTEPSYLQIIRNYANAVAKAGGKKIYEAEGLGCFSLKNKGVEYRVKVVATNTSDIQLSVVEMTAMQQDVQASVILDELNAKGHIALYINFATGKSAIEADSQKIIDQLAEMMQNNPDLKISIEGHTDNTGTPASNMTLSSGRANAVMAALTSKGIDKGRMTAKGLGQTKPIADNGNVEGKALNRRVEIVKQ